MKPEELESLAQKARQHDERFAHHISVCMESGCTSSQSDVVLAQLEEQTHKRGCSQNVRVKPVGCMGLCCNGPLVRVDDRLYQNVTPADAGEIITSLDGPAVDRLLCDTQQPFFTKQKLVVRENSGRTDPEDIADCIAHGA